MSLPVYHLRRWLIVIAVLFTAMVAGVYFYARVRQRNVLKEVPNKLGLEIKQTAAGFQISKSDGKRTLFTVQAGSVKQFKLDGSADLRKVSITLYGRDSSRFDQIYGDDFTYDKKSGDVIGRGVVQIDLQANPAGLTGPDQGAPREVRSTIHLKTTDLIFNQNSGDAFTDARVDFSTPQANGWSVGAKYSAKSNVLTLVSQIHVTLGGPEAATILATHGVLTHEPHVIVLDHAQLKRSAGIVRTEQATFFLGADNTVERVLGRGSVAVESTDKNGDQIHARADEGEMLLAGKQSLLRTATLTGHVRVERAGSEPILADAGSAVLDFAGRNQLQKIHAADGVRLAQHAAEKQAASSGTQTAKASQPQDFDITAPVIDFKVADGRRLERAETSGAAQITISPAQNSTAPDTASQRTVITADRFEAKFAPTADGSSRLSSVHGAPNAKIVNTAPDLPDRVSTSQTIDASFLSEGGIASIVQQGNVAYTDNQAASKRTQAWAERAVYTPGDRVLSLTGSPRVSEGSMLTTAKIIRINRTTDDAFAEVDVKTSYSEMKEQPNGALLASASPIHVTAARMTAHNSPAVALYQGNARLWQDANTIAAPSIQFDRDRRFLVAQADGRQPVSTVLDQSKLDETGTNGPGQNPPAKAEGTKGPSGKAQEGKSRKSSANGETGASDSGPIVVTSARLTYSDGDRLAHYEGGVSAKGTAFTLAANSMDVYFRPRGQTLTAVGNPGQLDHMVAEGSVVVVQPSRRAEAQALVYTASDDKFVLTGGPPSIFDAERGKITGVSLTFFRADDRVLVEGKASTPVVTQTRVAK